MKTDDAGNLYDDVSNVRITYVPSGKRADAKNWAGQDVIRLQAYKTDPQQSQALHMGAELPIESTEVFIDLISTLCGVYNIGRKNR